MFTATQVKAILDELKAEGMSKADIIEIMSKYTIGWPYVFGAYGQACTPTQRNKYAGYRQDHAAAIRSACPVLSGKATTCDACDWNGTLIDDCRGFTRLMLQWVGLNLYGGTVTAQWETASNWVAKGTIDTLPRGLVCCVFRPSHTGIYVGNDTVRHCGGKKGQVVEEQLPGTPHWERWAIPPGLYTTDELRKAGINVQDDCNIPTLRRGSRGEQVKLLQEALNETPAGAGMDLKADGIFGAETEKAVRQFQADHGLTVDGVVGRKTWAALGFATDNNVPGKIPEVPEPELDGQPHTVPPKTQAPETPENQRPPANDKAVDITTLKALYAQAMAMAGTLKKIIEGE